MTTRHEVSCITRDTTNDVDRRIDSLGGPDGGGWSMALDDVIRGLDNSAFTLFVRGGNALMAGEVEVLPRTGLLRRYVATVADGAETNNLLSLPQCPATYRRVT